MSEIVHVLAPGAHTYFACPGGGDPDFVGAVNLLLGHGCNIIVDDFEFADEPMFEEGIIAQNMDSYAQLDGATFVSAAGNAAADAWNAVATNVSTDNNGNSWVVFSGTDGNKCNNPAAGGTNNSHSAVGEQMGEC